MLTWKIMLLMIVLSAAVLLFVVVHAQSTGAKTPTLTALDYVEIEQLNVHYGDALDSCVDHGYQFADLFVPDGVFTFSNGKPVKGRDNLAVMDGGPNCNQFKSSPNNFRHINVNMLIEPSPEGAIGRSYFLQASIAKDGRTPQLVAGSKYHDVYVKTPQGWRYKSRSTVRVNPDHGPDDPFRPAR